MSAVSSNRFPSDSQGLARGEGVAVKRGLRAETAPAVLRQPRASGAAPPVTAGALAPA
jgi:hypothetical protein